MHLLARVRLLTRLYGSSYRMLNSHTHLPNDHFRVTVGVRGKKSTIIREQKNRDRVRVSVQQLNTTLLQVIDTNLSRSGANS